MFDASSISGKINVLGVNMLDDSLTSSFTKKEKGILSAVLLFIAFLTFADVYEDWIEGASSYHIVSEVVVILLLTSAAAYLLRGLVRSRHKAMSDTREELHRVKASAQSWQARAESLSHGITDAISAQFDQWGLTPAEQEVSFLLIKGLSIQEISEVRETSERTVRQQASEVYKKSQLSGRAQLAAFFLEDLFDQR
jgi:DNA-binding NarL/FixJ family response regulator